MWIKLSYYGANNKSNYFFKYSSNALFQSLIFGNFVFRSALYCGLLAGWGKSSERHGTILISMPLSAMALAANSYQEMPPSGVSLVR